MVLNGRAYYFFDFKYNAFFYHGKLNYAKRFIMQFHICL